MREPPRPLTLILTPTLTPTLNPIPPCARSNMTYTCWIDEHAVASMIEESVRHKKGGTPAGRGSLGGMDFEADGDESSSRRRWWGRKNARQRKVKPAAPGENSMVVTGRRSSMAPTTDSDRRSVSERIAAAAEEPSNAGAAAAVGGARTSTAGPSAGGASSKWQGMKVASFAAASIAKRRDESALAARWSVISGRVNSEEPLDLTILLNERLQACVPL